MTSEENEYKQKFDDLQEQSTFKGQTWFGKRKELVEEYSWGIPNQEVLIYLSEFDNIIEVGAGNGYWAKCIEQHGGSVRATDATPPDETWTTVERAYVDDLQLENEVVLTVWPPYGDSMAWMMADESPSHILYVGESRGGCTGSDGFFDILDREYGLVAKIDLPSYEGIHDNFFHYVRKV